MMRPDAKVEPPFATKQIGVAAVRRLVDRGKRNPAGPKASRAQPP